MKVFRYFYECSFINQLKKYFCCLLKQIDKKPVSMYFVCRLPHELSYEVVRRCCSTVDCFVQQTEVDQSPHHAQIGE